MNAPVFLHPRKRFTKNQRRAILDDQRGACACCGVSLDIEAGDRVEIDHDIPLALGGTNARGNLRALCHDCHLGKSRQDITAIAKAKRVEKKHAGTFRRSRNPLPANKDGRLKQKLDGSVIVRATGAVIKKPWNKGKS